MDLDRRFDEDPPTARERRLGGVDHGARIAPNEVAADDQDELALRAAEGALAEVGARVPLVDRWDVERAGRPCPEPAEERRPPFHGVQPPCQLTGHLVVGADERRLDEAPVDLDESHGVGVDVLQAGQHVLAVDGAEQLDQRHRERRGAADRGQRIRWPGDPGRHGNAGRRRAASPGRPAASHRARRRRRRREQVAVVVVRRPPGR